MRFSDKEIKNLIKYLEKREISPEDAIDIIHQSTPEGKESNRKFNWKMTRFTLYVWQRLSEEKEERNLNSKTESAKIVCEGANYKMLYEGYHDHSTDKPIKGSLNYNLDKEAKNLFKLVTDPRQKHLFKSRFFVYPINRRGIISNRSIEDRSMDNIPQDHLDYLMQWPKRPLLNPK